jgi:ABC-2 type transport system permease protein
VSAAPNRVRAELDPLDDVDEPERDVTERVDAPAMQHPEASLRVLLAPRVMATRNALRRRPLRAWVLAFMTAGFWVGSFLLFAETLRFFQTITALGPVLTQRLLVMLFVSFFAILLISNVVTALTTYYLSADVRFLLAAPVSTRRLHQARFLETLVASSWMVLLFGFPVFLVFGAGPLYYFAVLATLVPFLTLPAAIGVMLTTVLVLAFPARRMRDVLVVASVALVAGGYLALRLARPERLASPDELAGFAAFLAAFEAPASPYLPTTWAAEVLIPFLGERGGDSLFFLALLTTTAAVFALGCSAFVERSFLTAWSRAQEGREGPGRARKLGDWLGTVARPLPRTTALLFVKDATIFLRDASQWSQLLLLLALVVVYVYNFSALPIDDGSPLAGTLREIVAYANLGLAAFVTASVAVRFVFPAISLEGRSWWALRTAPIPLTSIWWGKFWIGFLPLAVLGEVLIVVTGRLLGVTPGLTGVFMATLLLVVAAIVSLGLAFGAAYPRVDTQNAAQIATGFGGLIYMVSCLALIFAVIALEAWPVSRLFWSRFAAQPIGTGETAAIAISFSAVAVLTVATWAVARRSALKSLAHLRV